MFTAFQLLDKINTHVSELQLPVARKGYMRRWSMCCL